MSNNKSTVSLNMPVLSVEKVTNTLTDTYVPVIEKGLSPKVLPSVMLWGPPGVGKSQAIRQIAKNIEERTDKKAKITDVRLLLFNPIDVRGIPTSNADKTLAVWLKPQIFQRDDSEAIVKMLFLATKQELSDNSVEFSDVNKEEWYYPYIASGVKLGWIQGISETLFGVGSPLTRQDMAVLIERASGIESGISQALFSDDNLISDYAKEAVYRLRNKGIINGDDENRFNPKSFATRAEAAKIIYEMMVKGGKE